MNLAKAFLRRRGAWLLLCAVAASGIPSPGRVGGGPPAQQLPAGLKLADWEAIRAEYERNRHAAFPALGGHRARNFRQQWRAHFDGRGFQVEPDDGGWTWGLELVGHGERAQVTIAKERVSYRWNSALEEWFVNDTRGLEHGFLLWERPPGSGEHLEIRLAVRGGLRPRVEDGGRAVSFLNEAGKAVVNYAGLKVWDADGRSLGAHFQAETNLLRLVVDDRGARYPLTIDPTAQQAYLKASNAGATDFFGRSVAVSGDTVVVSAILEDSNATGVNGDQTNNSNRESGAVYVFVRSGSTWTQQAYLKASNPDRDDQFGQSVAVSGDTVVVGTYHESSNATGVNGDQSNNLALGSGAAYVFVRNGSTWAQEAYLKASNTDQGDAFGWSVAVSGNTVVVGAWRESSNATGVNGDQANNSAPVSGAAYVFVRDGATWSQQAYLKASNAGADDRFGDAVAVSGDTIVVGAPGEDSNATGANGDQTNDSAPGSGAAYVFVRTGTTWTQQAYLKASNTGEGDGFASVAVSGGTVVVGATGEGSNATGVNGDQTNNSAPGSGAAYVFVRSGSIWTQQAYLKASNTEAGDSFGRVAVSGDTVVVGASGESSNAPGVNGDQTNNLATGSGAAYVFVRSGSTWSQQAYLKASNPGPPVFEPSIEGDYSSEFGRAVAVSGGTVVVGAFGEASNATGVNGDQTNKSASATGAAYVFELDNPSASFAPNGVANAASFAGGPIAPGQIISIFGVNLGPAVGAGPAVDPATGRLATTREEVTVLFDNTPGALFFVRQDQINVQVPYELAGQTSAQVVVRYRGVSSPPVTVPVRPSAPGIFTVTQNGTGQAALLNQNSTANSASNPAARESVVQIFMTGQGQTNPAGVTGALPAIPTPTPMLPVTVTIGGRPAQTQFVGLAPGLAGLLQINAVVPQDVTPGTAVELSVTIGAIASQAGVTLSVL
jgi:uncharacterized protein (TIGR03437 family)